MRLTDSRALGARWRYLVAAAAVVLGFGIAYAAAGYLAPSTDSGATAAAVGNSTDAQGGGALAAGGGCCGAGEGAGAPVSGTAVTTGGMQRLSVAVNAAGYAPNVLQLTAGVPAEITFSQSSGCTASVISDDLGFNADLTGGPQTVRLPALEEGTYAFSCGMRMVSGSVVVTAGETGQ